MGDHELSCYLAKLEYRYVDHAVTVTVGRGLLVYHDVAVTVLILVILLALWLELRSHIDNDDNIDDDDYGGDYCYYDDFDDYRLYIFLNKMIMSNMFRL